MPLLPVILLLFATFAVPATLHGATLPAPYAATYSVHYRGLNAGLLHFELFAEEDGRFVYESHAEPGMLARFIIGDAVAERSVMHIDEEGVRPLSWFMSEGSLRFLWEEERVTGVVEGQQVEIPTEPGLQDRLSIQVAVMTALLRGMEPGTIPMVDEVEIKHYRYAPLGFGPVRTQAGEFATVLYESTRPGSSRTSRLWHAPELGYITVRAEQLRRGKIETVLELVKVTRTAD
jgi:hypothetical protein